MFRAGLAGSVLVVLTFFGSVSIPAGNVHAASFQAGDLVKANTDAVYYCGADGKRYVFPDEKTFKTWYPDFSTVKTISAGELASMMIGGNVTYRPGTRMVKIQTDPKVYAVDAHGTLRWVQSEQVAVSLYGADWNRQIDDISVAFFPYYNIGASITSTADFNRAAVQQASPTISIDKQLNVPEPDPATDYLIISTDALFSSALKLRDYRASRNHVAAAVSLSTISSNPTAQDIDNWIEDFRASHQSLRYVVLMGDGTALPSFLKTLTDSTKILSDLNYAVTGSATSSHYLPELSIGRIPAATTAEVDRYLTKIQTFESSFRHQQTMIFFGHQPELQYAANRDVALAEDAGYATILLTDPSEEQLLQAIKNNDVAAVWYYGHGSWFINDPFTIDTVAKLQNATYPFLYFSGGCGFGDATSTHGSISQSLLLSNVGAGAAMGASQNGGYGFEYLFIAGVLNVIGQSSTVGDIFSAGLLAEDQAAKAPDSVISSPVFSYEFFERMSIVGDPAMRLR